MFCDGKCENGKKRCGLYANMTMKNDLTGELKQYDRCILYSVMDSLARQEQGQIRVERAVESSRNESVEQMHMARDTIARGFLGLINEAESRNKFLKETQEEESKKLLKDNSVIFTDTLGVHKT